MCICVFVCIYGKSSDCIRGIIKCDFRIAISFYDICRSYIHIELYGPPSHRDSKTVERSLRSKLN